MKKLWDKLPYELQVQIIIRLSPESICRLRLTCKSFYFLFSHPLFAIDYDRAANPNFLAQRSWRCPTGNGLFFNHDTVLCLQREDACISSTAPTVLQRSCNVSSTSEVTNVVTCGDGFLCYKTSSDSDMWLVLNPLFPAERFSVNMCYAAKSDNWLRGIAFDRKHGVCKLVLFSSPSSTYVYNFKENIWKIMERSPNWERFYQKEYESFPIILNERFLCWQVSTNVNPPMVAETAVLVFDVENDSWQELIPIDTELFKDFCIAEHNKQLCAVTKTKWKKGEIMFQLWKFDMENRTWRPSENIPPPPGKFPGGYRKTHRVWGGRGFLRLVGMDSSRKTIVWVYDISNRLWQKLTKIEYTEPEARIMYKKHNSVQTVQCFQGSIFKLR